jgi:hypothetical protein
MKRKLIALFVLLGSAGLAQAGCSDCGCGPSRIERTETADCPSCGKCCNDCGCGFLGLGCCGSCS